MSTIVAGEGAGRFRVGLTQGLRIIVFTLVAFGVTRGIPWDGGRCWSVWPPRAPVGRCCPVALFRNDRQAGCVFPLGCSRPP